LRPPAWQYPDIAAARITFDGKVFKTRNFRKTRWTQSADIVVGGERAGKAEVSYLKKMPKEKEGPFVEEERKLINVFAGKLGRIAAQRRAKKDLESREAWFRDFFDKEPYYCYMVSPEGRIMDINRMAVRTLGYDKEEIIGKPVIPTIYAPSCHDKAKRLFARWKKTGKLENEEMQIITRNGEERTVLLNVDAVRDRSGKILHSISAQVDISERKMLEKLKDEFVSIVSHELKTPLAIIKQSLYVLASEKYKEDRDKKREYFDMIGRNTDLLARLINDILDYQKLVAGKMKFEMGKRSINELVKGIKKEMSPLAGERGLTLSVKLAKGLPSVKFDKDRITQVLMNLLNNAIKFTDKGGISIITGKEKNSVRVSVKDTGIGIRKEDTGRIFDGFVQIWSGKGRPKGTGLGLVVSKKIIEQHGGRIRVESGYGKGSTFSFTIPASGRGT
jgi:PAS domain S-box-containing protein